MFPEQGQFKGSMIVPNVEQNIRLRRVFHPTPIYRWGDGGLGFTRRSLFCLFVRNLPLTDAASFWGGGGRGRCTVIGHGQLGGSRCHAVRSTCHPSVLLGLTARPGKGTAALECCGKGSEVQMGGWALLLSGYKVGEKNPHPRCIWAHVSFFPTWQDTERFQAHSQELEQKLLSKEQELEQLIQKQKRVRLCRGLGAPGPSSAAESCPLSPLFTGGFGFVCLSVFNPRRTMSCTKDSV